MIEIGYGHGLPRNIPFLGHDCRRCTHYDEENGDGHHRGDIHPYLGWHIYHFVVRHLDRALYRGFERAPSLTYPEAWIPRDLSITHVSCVRWIKVIIWVIQNIRIRRPLISAPCKLSMARWPSSMVWYWTNP